jgi:hypothetical protein
MLGTNEKEKEILPPPLLPYNKLLRIQVNTNSATWYIFVVIQSH